jgi:hypothetical protein
MSRSARWFCTIYTVEPLGLSHGSRSRAGVMASVGMPQDGMWRKGPIHHAHYLMPSGWPQLTHCRGFENTQHVRSWESLGKEEVRAPRLADVRHATTDWKRYLHTCITAPPNQPPSPHPPTSISVRPTSGHRTQSARTVSNRRPLPGVGMGSAAFAGSVLFQSTAVAGCRLQWNHHGPLLNNQLASVLPKSTMQPYWVGRFHILTNFHSLNRIKLQPWVRSHLRIME